MELKIVNKKENPMLNRTELSGELTFKGVTPSNADMQKTIAGKLKVDPSVVKMKNIYTIFGETKATFEANVYKTKEDLERFEPLGKKAKEKIAKTAEAAKTKAEAPKEAPKAEAPKAEEKKEEPKKEAPKEEAKPAEEKKEEPKKEEKKEEAPKEKPKE